MMKNIKNNEEHIEQMSSDDDSYQDSNNKDNKFIASETESDSEQENNNGVLKSPKLAQKKPFTYKDDSKNPMTAIKYVSTEGIPGMLYNNVDKNLSKTVALCFLCEKIYMNDMLVPSEINTERQCYHCLFAMNYPVTNRKKVDGTFGMFIVDYILKCKDVHELDACTKKSDSGGCFLCEYNLGIPITDVKNLEKLNYNFDNELPDHPEDDIVDDLVTGMKNMDGSKLVIDVEI
jgi:hypothetical protein